MTSPRWRLFLSSLVLGVALISPAASLGAAHGTNRPLTGKSTGTATLSLLTGATTSQFSGQLSHLGAFTGTADELFTPLGLPPLIPYTLMGTETLVAANGEELFGTVNGTGLNNTVGLTAQGTNVVTITGGTGRFAGATGTYTETYSSSYVVSGTTVTGPFTTTAQGQISY
jgi:hypothetical protein